MTRKNIGQNTRRNKQILQIKPRLTEDGYLHFERTFTQMNTCNFKSAKKKMKWLFV